MKRLAVAVVCAIMLIAAVSHAQTYAGDQKFLRNVEIGRSLTVNGATSIGSALSIDAISEKTPDAGVTIDGVKLKDGGALVITGGTNTYNITNGTAVIDVASGASVDINDDLTVSAASTINQDVSTDASPTFAGGDFSDGNITNVGDIDVDSISADGTTVDYNDVNILELVQEDVGATCTLGQIRFDTGGGTKELCYCEAENTWVCAALAAGPTD